MKTIVLSDSQYETLLILLNKLGAEYPDADDIADTIAYGGVLND